MDSTSRSRKWKIACDNGISGRAIPLLEAAGHEVVFWAGDEPDEWWFPMALAEGADFFVSHDFDVIYMADERKIASYQMPNGIGGREQAAFILKALEKAK